MQVTLDPVILPGQIWERIGGKHAGWRGQVVTVSEYSVTVKVLKTPRGARNWGGKKADGQLWTMGRAVFEVNYRRIHESGGGSVHDAPLPPAALREPMVFIDESIPVPAEPLTEPAILEPRITFAPAVKTCSKCREIKDISHFSSDRSRTDGLQIYCKPCKAEARRSYSKSGLSREASRIAKFEALTAEQKNDIRSLRDAGISRYEIMKEYHINGAIYGMVIGESELEAAVNPVPEAPKPELDAYIVTVLVMRPVEEQMTIHASSLIEAAQKGADEGEVLSVSKVRE